MTNRKKTRSRSRRSTTRPFAHGDERQSFRHYIVLAVTCVGIAAVIAVIVGFLLPLDDETERDVAGTVNPLQETSSTTPTMQLPSSPAAISAKDLQDELLSVGAELMDRYPKVPEALHVAAMLYSDFNKTSEAERVWKQCVKLAPKQPGPYVGLAGAAMDLGKNEVAIETLRQALGIGCSTPDVFHHLGAALTKQGQLQEAADVIREGLAAFPHAADNWLQLGQVQLQLQKPGEAEASLRKAISEGCTASSVYFALATACARQDRQDEAAKFREEFVKRKQEQRPTTSDQFQDLYDSQLRQIAVATIGRAATIYDRQGQTAKAESLFLRALSLDPRNAVVGGELAMFYRRQGRMADALMVQKRLVEIEPQTLPHFINLASIAAQVGDHALAESALKHVITMRPNLSIGYSGLAKLYLRRAQFDEARRFAESALQHEATSQKEILDTYFVLAASCEQLGDDSAAEAALARARILAPNDPRLESH